MVGTHIVPTINECISFRSQPDSDVRLRQGINQIGVDVGTKLIHNSW